MTDATAVPAEFTAAQIAQMQEVDSIVRESEKQGSAARINQAFALNALVKTDGFRALVDEDGQPFGSFRQYILRACPTLSEPAANKAVKVVNLLEGEDREKMVRAGIEKLYQALSLVDKKVITLSQVVDFATEHTSAELRQMQATNGLNPEKKYPLVDFGVTRAHQERFGGVMNVFRNALKIAGDGAEPSDWQVIESLTETVATLDKEYIIQTVKGEGDGGPRASTTFTDTPAPVVVKWIVQQYVDAGMDEEGILAAIQTAIGGEVAAATDRKRAAEAQAKAEAQDAKKAEKRTEANKNKLIRLSANISVETNLGHYFVVDVFKDSNSAHVKTLKDGEFAITDENGAPVNLDELAAVAVNITKVKVEKPKVEKAAPAQFSKEAQAAKGKGSKKAAAPKKGKAAPADEE